ncbi:MAG: DUF4198 domain-containing protein [Methanococcoides sp.]|nr:DUF4198 domain-containing protein [Methanococcoides sp.]
MRIFGKKLAMLGLSLALMLGVFSIPAGAHFMWINAGDYTPPTERPVKFTIGWGHAFASPVGNIMYKQGGLDKIYDPVDLLPSQKNRYNILCVIFKHNATYCVLIFKIGVNQQSHISA